MRDKTTQSGGQNHCAEVSQTKVVIVVSEFDSTRQAAWSAFETDLAGGLYAVMPIPGAEHCGRAGELADKDSATEGSRSLDLLHVAAALFLQAGELLGFDSRQRKVAVGEGLKVRPN